MQGVWRIQEAMKGVVEKNGRMPLHSMRTDRHYFRFNDVSSVERRWQLLVPVAAGFSSSTMQVDLSVRCGSDSVYKTFAACWKFKTTSFISYGLRVPDPKAQSVQELRRGETCFVMTRIGDSPMTPEEVILVAKEKLFEKRRSNGSIQSRIGSCSVCIGEPSDGHREGETTPRLPP